MVKHFTAIWFFFILLNYFLSFRGTSEYNVGVIWLIFVNASNSSESLILIITRPVLTWIPKYTKMSKILEQ